MIGKVLGDSIFLRPSDEHAVGAQQVVDGRALREELRVGENLGGGGCRFGCVVERLERCAGAAREG